MRPVWVRRARQGAERVRRKGDISAHHRKPTPSRREGRASPELSTLILATDSHACK